MAHILVVEDSPEQARMVSAIMQAAGYATEIASNGLEALQSIGKNRPDLVITDLIMPGLNGLELVEAIRKDHPSIPVILMTAFGSGEIAVRALRQGAASYVPKRRLRDEIARTVETTLGVAQAAREQERMFECLVESECRFVCDNDLSLVPALAGHIREIIGARWKKFDETRLMQVGIAVQEALLNAMHHGNLEVSSKLREDDTDAYRELLEQRRDDPTYRDRRVSVSLKISASELSVVVRDEGPGFDPTVVADPTDPANLENVSGRGLYLIWTFMDRVSHNETGNEITMVKRLERADDAA